MPNAEQRPEQSQSRHPDPRNPETLRNALDWASHTLGLPQPLRDATDLLSQLPSPTPEQLARYQAVPDLTEKDLWEEPKQDLASLTPLVDEFIHRAAVEMSQQKWKGWDEIEVTDDDMQRVRETTEKPEVKPQS